MLDQTKQLILFVITEFDCTYICSNVCLIYSFTVFVSTCLSYCIIFLVFTCLFFCCLFLLYFSFGVHFSSLLVYWVSFYLPSCFMSPCLVVVMRLCKLRRDSLKLFVWTMVLVNYLSNKHFLVVWIQHFGLFLLRDVIYERPRSLHFNLFSFAFVGSCNTSVSDLTPMS